MIPSRYDIRTEIGYTNAERGFDPDAYTRRMRDLLPRMLAGRVVLDDDALQPNPLAMVWRSAAHPVVPWWRMRAMMVVRVVATTQLREINNVIGKAFREAGAGSHFSETDIVQALNRCVETPEDLLCTRDPTRFGRFAVADTVAHQLPARGRGPDFPSLSQYRLVRSSSAPPTPTPVVASWSNLQPPSYPENVPAPPMPTVPTPQLPIPLPQYPPGTRPEIERGMRGGTMVALGIGAAALTAVVAGVVIVRSK